MKIIFEECFIFFFFLIKNTKKAKKRKKFFKKIKKVKFSKWLSIKNHDKPPYFWKKREKRGRVRAGGA